MAAINVQFGLTMRLGHAIGILLALASAASLACSALTPTRAAPPAESTTPAPPTAAPSLQPSLAPSLEPTASPTVQAATATPAPTAVPVASPTATTAALRLEIVQSQAWTDSLGLVRVNVLLRNPYDFPVAPGFAGASTRNSAGELIRGRDLYFLDGISGGVGFLLPGEAIAANACFTCETSPLPEPWSSVEVVATAEDATGLWNYSTDVEGTVSDVSFAGDSAIFDIAGTAKNNSDAALSVIAVRVNVFDEAGKLIGAGVISAYDVAAGATASARGYGIGEPPAGPFTYEATALGVTY
jgi:hypothetical protein